MTKSYLAIKSLGWSSVEKSNVLGEKTCYVNTNIKHLDEIRELLHLDPEEIRLKKIPGRNVFS